MTKKKISIFAILAIALLAPFSHLFSTPAQEGILGFTYMSSFLFAIGWPVSIIAIAILFYKAVNLLKEEHQTLFKWVANALLGLGIYYLIYTLAPLHRLGLKDFPKPMYYLAVLVISVVLVVVFRILKTAAIYTEEALKSTIKRLVSFIISSEEKYVEPSKQIDYFNEYIEELNQINQKL